MAAAATGGAGTARWIIVGVVAAIVVALLVWGGTQKAVDAVRPADMAYLKQNKDKPGVKTTASGLQYEVLTEGTGARPGPKDTVMVHYEGKLIDGTVFDSSIQRGEPAVFPLDAVIPGWTEGVQLMTPGSKYRFVIPPAIGYGAKGADGVIPPNAVLLFDIELLAIRGK